MPVKELLKLESTEGGVSCVHAVDAVEEGDPATWGVILADAIRHVARGRSQKYGDDEWSVVNRVVQVLVDEIELQRNDPTRGNVSGGVEVEQ